MSRTKGLLARIRSIVDGRAAESRMDEEFRFHVDMEARRLAAERGLRADEARRQALVAFGGFDNHRETMRDGRGGRWFDDLTADVRYALRAMRRSPGFAIAVALTLGIGIGVNGIVFSTVDALLFRPLPVRHPERLVALFNVDARSRQAFQVGYKDYIDFRDRSGVFNGLAAMSGVPLNLVVPSTAGVADMVWGEMVSENYFSVLDMRPAAGRFFSTADGPQGANPFAVISYDAWQQRFGGRPSVVGETIRINGSAFTVLGVAPRGFKGMRTFGFWPEVWVPVGMHDVAQPGSARLFDERGGGSFMVVGRTRPGVDRVQTEREAARFAKQLALAYPATNANAGAMVIPASAGFDDPNFAKPAVLMLVAALASFASIATLVIICANLANLQLARAAARIHEVAIRLSLGCSRGRLVRQMLVEAVLLMMPGALLAAELLRLGGSIETWMEPHLTFRIGFGSSADARVVAFTAAIALLAVMLFGLGPALRASSAGSLSNLVGAPRTSSPRPARLRGLLVVGQLALSVVLLVVATLFVRSLLKARASDVGFDARDRAVMSMNVGLQNYDERKGRRFYDEVVARVQALPQVVSAAWAFPVPFDTYGRSVALYVPGMATHSKDGTIAEQTSTVSEAFIDAMGLRLESGRHFAISDSVGAPDVMMVSRTLARELWPGRNPIGQHARRGGASGPEITVIGVVDDAKFEPLGPERPAHVYLPLRQNYRGWQTLVVHTRGDPRAIINRVRAAVASVDPMLPVYGISTMGAGVANGLSTSRTAAAMAAFFGAVALLISSVGLYAVVASGVAERTREIGIRVALGSTPGEVMRYVMRGGARLGILGLLLGLAGAAIVARLTSALLYGVSPGDSATFAIVPATLIVVVLLATFIPARRAVKLDPVAALRSD